MIYNATTRLAEAALKLRARLGGSDALRERLMIGPAPTRSTIWVHGASVGELTSARQVILTLQERTTVQITANSETGRDLARDWGLSARLAPLDLPGALDCFLRCVQPRLLVTIESEFWPLRSRFLAQRGIAHAMIGARMSERSAGTWSRLPRIIGPMLGRISALSAQDQASEARLLQLGLRRAALMPRLDLKLLDPARIVPAPHDLVRGRTLLAASTHEGEDAPILSAFAALCADHPDLRLILAPRHPDRADAIAALIADLGLPCLRRSAGHDAPAPGGVLLADSLGEMDRWYRAAGTCIVAGSFMDHGGHTPWEPAAHRCALVTGSHVGNFIESYAALEDGDALLRADTTNLPQVLHRLLSQDGAIAARGTAARRVLDNRAGDPGPLIARILTLASEGPQTDINTL
ncbi:MAG: glycosyltransferase N-terminal domain-containing protein [Paracoccus sp. (in: a-proteobacteria)]|nr:glycosyltransferase N-terminal domain-containing protein [Paracoccus sp. (in: a-proteobacteria)]